MYYDDYQLWGMHFGWWLLWILFLFWIFALPYRIPGQRSQKDTPLETLKRRFAAGEISDEEFSEKKKKLIEK